MDTFQAYFKYEMKMRLRHPVGSRCSARPTTGGRVRRRAQMLSEYGLEHWTERCCPCSIAIVSTAEGADDPSSGSRSSTTRAARWARAHRLDPRAVSVPDSIAPAVPNPHLATWRKNFGKSPRGWRDTPGPSMTELPGGLASAPVRVERHPYRRMSRHALRRRHVRRRRGRGRRAVARVRLGDHVRSRGASSAQLRAPLGGVLERGPQLRKRARELEQRVRGQREQLAVDGGDDLHARRRAPEQGSLADVLTGFDRVDIASVASARSTRSSRRPVTTMNRGCDIPPWRITVVPARTDRRVHRPSAAWRRCAGSATKNAFASGSASTSARGLVRSLSSGDDVPGFVVASEPRVARRKTSGSVGGSRGASWSGIDGRPHDAGGAGVSISSRLTLSISAVGSTGGGGCEIISSSCELMRGTCRVSSSAARSSSGGAGSAASSGATRCGDVVGSAT